MTKLSQAEAHLAAAQALLTERRTALDALAQAQQHQQRVIAAEKTMLARLEEQAAPIHRAVAEAKRKADDMAETVLEQLNINCAGATMKLHARDPVEHYETVIKAAARIDAARRTGFDVSDGQERTHPLVMQAVGLIPKVDDIKRHVYDLGFQQQGVSDWGTRRDRMIPEMRQLLNELSKLLAESTPPLQAA